MASITSMPTPPIATGRGPEPRRSSRFCLSSPSSHFMISLLFKSVSAGFDLFEIRYLKGLVVQFIGRTVKPHGGQRPLALRGNPVRLETGRRLGTDVNRHASVSVLLHLLEVVRRERRAVGIR